jgi:hydrogenase expression/formation protein HypD
MTIDSKTFSERFRDPVVAQALIRQIEETADRPMRLMEVCGTHTMAIFRHGIRGLLPPGINLLSGPGCPVCVTDTMDINAFIALSQREEVILATFGDLLRVPGSFTSLRKEVAEGADVRVVYSPMDAVDWPNSIRNGPWSFWVWDLKPPHRPSPRRCWRPGRASCPISASIRRTKSCRPPFRP